MYAQIILTRMLDHSMRRGWANRELLFNGIDYTIEVMKNSEDGQW